MLLLGYLFLLRRVQGKLSQSGAFSLTGLLVPLMIILVAPLLDVILKRTIALPYSEIGTAIGVLASLSLGMMLGKVRPAPFVHVVRKARPWKYMLIIFAMFAFLNVFTTSGIPESIGAMALPPVVLCVVIGVLLGLITGRIQSPMSILIPIYATMYGVMSAPAFAVTYFAVFLGYILTPIHPCISVSLEYFRTSLGAFLKRMAVPIAAAFLITLTVSLLLFWHVPL
jgi:uncharacterized protein